MNSTSVPRGHLLTATGAALTDWTSPQAAAQPFLTTEYRHPWKLEV